MVAKWKQLIALGSRDMSRKYRYLDDKITARLLLNRMKDVKCACGASLFCVTYGGSKSNDSSSHMIYNCAVCDRGFQHWGVYLDLDLLMTPEEMVFVFRNGIYKRGGGKGVTFVEAMRKEIHKKKLQHLQNYLGICRDVYIMQYAHAVSDDESIYAEGLMGPVVHWDFRGVIDG